MFRALVFNASGSFFKVQVGEFQNQGCEVSELYQTLSALNLTEEISVKV